MSLDFSLLGGQGLGNPLQMANAGYQTGLQNQLIQQQLEAQKQAQIDAQKAQEQNQMLMQQALAGDVTAQSQLALLAAKNGQETQQAFAMLDKPKREERKNIAYRWDALARSNPDALMSEVDNRISALENSDPTPDNQREIAELKAAKLFPKEYLPILTMGMVAQYDPDNVEKYTKSVFEQQKLPATLAESQAKATTAQVEARFAPQRQVIEIENKKSEIQRRIDQTTDETERRALEAQKLDLDRQKLLIQARQKEMKPLSAGAQKIADQFTQDSLDALNAASMARDVIAKYDQLDPSMIERAFTASGLGGVFGTDFQNLADQYEILRKKVVQTNKPGAGPISDADLKFMQQGIPSATSDPKRVREWLGRFAAIQDKNAVFEDMRANWMQQNGSLGKLKEPLELSNGDVVPAGTSLTEAARMFRDKRLGGSVESKTIVPANDAIKQLIDAGYTPQEAKRLVGGK